MKKAKKGTTLVELLITLSVFSVISAMLLSTIIAFAKNVGETKELVRNKAHLSNVNQGLYNFLNNSVSAHFIDNDDTQLDYLNATFTDKDPRLDILFLVKDNSGTTGRLVYNDSDTENPKIEWFKDNNASAQLICEGVFRIDTIWDIDGNRTDGNEPIFKFPHRIELYSSGNPLLPNIVIIQFRKVIVDKNYKNKVPVTVPMTLMFEVHGTITN